MPPPRFLARLSAGGQPLGSAILVRPDILLTCWHVLEDVGPRQKIVIDIDGATHFALCPKGQRDPLRDLAILRLPQLLDGIEIPPWCDISKGAECEYFAFPGGTYRWGRAAVRGEHSDSIEIDLAFAYGASGGAVVRSRQTYHYAGIIRKGEAAFSIVINKAVIDAFLEAQGVAPAGPGYLPRYDPDLYLRNLRAETRWIELRELGVDLKDTISDPGMDALYHPLTTVFTRGAEENVACVLE